MIPEIGLAALWLAAAFAGLAVVDARLAHAATYAQVVLLAVALAALIVVFVAVDLSVEAVIARTDLALPLAYRIAAAVDASPALVGATLLAIVAAVAALGAAPAALLTRFGAAALVADAWTLSASPFARALPAPTAGNGFDIADQVPGLVALVPLDAAAVVALLAGALWGRRDTVRRGAWAASALFGAAALVALRLGWETHGTLRLGGEVYASAGATLLAATLGPRRAVPVMVFGALTVAATQGATVVVTGTRALTPTAGPNWTAVEAAVDVDGTTLHPQWRDYTVPSRARGQAAVTGATAVVLLDPARLRTERRPSLRWAWLAGIAAVAAASFAAWRRP